MEKFVFVLALAACLASLAASRNPRSYMLGDRTTFITPDVKHYRGVTLHMMERQFITFQVRACWDAHIYIVRYTFDFDNSTEVIIGGWKNKRSAIRLGPDSNRQRVVLIKETPGLLSCEEFRQFWISWKNDTILVGRGPIYGQQILLNYYRKRARPYNDLNELKFAAGWGAIATWRIKDNTPESMTVMTSPKYGYQDIWKTTKYKNKFFTFEVLACAHAHIALAETEGVFRRRAYEIVIGGWNNTKSVIRMFLQGNSPRATNLTKNMLDCNVDKTFWVSWKGQTIMAGIGTKYNQNVFLRWVSPRPLRMISAIGFSTGWGVTGEWWFHENQEPQYTIEAPRVVEDKMTYVTTPRQSLVNFYVQSCQSAQLVLSPGENPQVGPSATLVIGGNGNTRTYLTEKGSSQESVGSDTYGILECGRWLPFFLTWNASNHVIFGKWRVSTAVGSALTWKSTFGPVNSVGFNSPSSISNFMIRGNQAEFVYTVTKNNFENNFVTVHQEYYKVVWVQACSDARIQLTPEDGVLSPLSYAIVLGYNGNQQTAIMQPLLGEVNMTVVDTPNILACTEWRVFWVSWLDNILRAGSGWTFLANPIIQAKAIVKYPVSSLNLASDTVKAEWVVEEDRGDKIRINTTSGADYQWFRYSSSSPKWMYFMVMGCSDARIALAREYHNNPSSIYEIYVGHQSNTQVSILKGGAIKATQSADKMLKCDVPKAIWVSWEGGVIILGKGSVKGDQQVIAWRDPSAHPVESIGVASDASTPVEWKFAEMDIVESSVSLNDNLGFRQFWMSARHRQRLVLGVKACQGLHISLATILGFNHTNYQYEIGLLATEDQQSFIKSGKFGEVLQQAPTPYIMNCNEERFLWLSWNNGVILVGKGNKYGPRIMLTLHDMNPLQVGAVGFMIEPGVTAKLRLLHTVDESTVFTDMSRPIPRPGDLTPGQKAGAAIGFLLLFALFGLCVYIIFRPPEPLRPLVMGQSAPQGPATATGFENPQFSGSEVQPTT